MIIKENFMSNFKYFFNTKKHLAVLLAALFSATASAGDIPGDGNLTLQNAVRLAVKNAPSMVMEGIKLDLAKADEQEAGDPFGPLFKASAALDEVRGYRFPSELQAFPAALGAASAAMSAYNEKVLLLSPSLAPAISGTSLSTFMTDRQNNSEFKSSLSKLFRSGIYTELSIALQGSASDKLRTDLSQIPGVLNSGIPGFMAPIKPGATIDDYRVIHPSLVQMTINFPLLKFRGENNIATANENFKRYTRESAEMTLKYSVSSIIQNVLSSYWDFKAALTRLHFTEESEAMVALWLSKFQSAANKSTDDASRPARMGEVAHLSGFATRLRSDISAAKEAVNITRGTLAEALGISADQARLITQAQDEFPLDWNDVLASFNEAGLRAKWNALAEQNRFDLKASSLQLDAANAIHRGAKNDVLPKLDLALIFKQQGLSANGQNRIDFHSLTEGRSATGSTVQLAFEMKLDNSKAKAQVTRTHYLILQKESEYNNTKRTMVLGVDAVVSSVHNSLMGLAAAKEETQLYSKALSAAVKNDTIEAGKVTEVVIIEQARLKAFIGNVTAIQNVANTISLAHFRTGKLLRQSDGFQEVAISDITRLP